MIEKLIKNLKKEYDYDKKLIFSTIPLSKKYIKFEKERTANLKNGKGCSKPRGVWYSFGAIWLEILEKYKWGIKKILNYKYIFEVDINYKKIYKISNVQELDEFHLNYSIESGINWDELAKKYDGIEIRYLSERDNPKGKIYYKWYDGWDCSSGCIWRPSGLIKIKSINLKLENLK